MPYLRLRMSEADRATYGGAEWLDYRDDDMLDLPFDEVEKIEDTIGMSLMVLRAVETPRYSARALRTLLWLARRQGGHEDDWATFKPNVQRVDAVPVLDEPREGDALPPDSTGDSSTD